MYDTTQDLTGRCVGSVGSGGSKNMRQVLLSLTFALRYMLLFLLLSACGERFRGRHSCVQVCCESLMFHRYG